MIGFGFIKCCSFVIIIQKRLIVLGSVVFFRFDIRLSRKQSLLLFSRWISFRLCRAFFILLVRSLSRVEFKINFVSNIGEIWPSISFLFWEYKLSINGDLKGPCDWKLHIFISFLTVIFIFSRFNGHKVIRHNIPLNDNLWLELLF